MKNEDSRNGKHTPSESLSIVIIGRTVLFPLGQIVITRNAMSRLAEPDAILGLMRHSQGDWGEVPDEDREENELSLKHGFRLMSVYTSSDGVKFWIITEADRSSTTILLPEDY